MTQKKITVDQITNSPAFDSTNFLNKNVEKILDTDFFHVDFLSGSPKTFFGRDTIYDNVFTDDFSYYKLIMYDWYLDDGSNPSFPDGAHFFFRSNGHKTENGPYPYFYTIYDKFAAISTEYSSDILPYPYHGFYFPVTGINFYSVTYKYDIVFSYSRRYANVSFIAHDTSDITAEGSFYHKAYTTSGSPIFEQIDGFEIDNVSVSGSPTYTKSTETSIYPSGKILLYGFRID